MGPEAEILKYTILTDSDLWIMILKIVGAIVVFDMIKFFGKKMFSLRFGVDFDNTVCRVDKNNANWEKLIKEQIDLTHVYGSNINKVCDILDKYSRDITDIGKDVAVIKEMLK